jgi:hypothetical protein
MGIPIVPLRERYRRILWHLIYVVWSDEVGGSNGNP